MAGPGIGRAAAPAFAREGARVVASDRDRDGGDPVRAGRRDHRGRGRGADRAGRRRLRRLDRAFNDAGDEGPGVPIREHAEEEWDRVMATNPRGAWPCTRAAIPRMLATGGVAIVNAASILGQDRGLSRETV